MNKFFYFALAAVAFIAATATIVSCSDDDDDEGMGSTSAGVVANGLRISKIDGYNVYYNSDGRVSSIGSSKSNPKVRFEYNPNKIYFSDNYDGIDEGIDVTYNGAGYITRMKYDSDYSGYKQSQTVTFSYGSNGLMTKWSIVANGVNENDGKRTAYTTSETATYTYKNDRIVSADLSGKDDESKWTETYLYEYDKEPTINIHQQWVKTINPFIDDEFELLGYLGLFGKGCKYLPSGSEQTYNDDGYEDSDSDSYSYRLNSDGSIYSVYYYGTTYLYYDNDYNSNSNTHMWANDEAGEESSSVTKLSHRNFGMRRSH